MWHRVQARSRRTQIRFCAGLLAILLVAGCSSAIENTHSQSSFSSGASVVTSTHATRTLTANPRTTKSRRPVARATTHVARRTTHAPVVKTHVPSTPAPLPSPQTTRPAPPPQTTHVALPPRTSSAAASRCYPLTNGGNCYEPGEYCRSSDHGATGIAGDGKRITCEDNNGWRWEPS